MVELIIVTHGTLAKSLVESAEMLVGAQDHVSVFGLCLGDSVDELRLELEQAIRGAAARGEVLVLTDMVSGSPFNAVCALSQAYAFEHLTGINFPIFLEILSTRDEYGAKELVATALAMAIDTVVDAKKYLEEVM